MIVVVTFVRAMPFTKNDAPQGMIGNYVDQWMRGESKFNVALSHMAISQDSFGHLLEMLMAYDQAFNPQLQAPQKSRIIVP